jgi:hypothetical protein
MVKTGVLYSATLAVSTVLGTTFASVPDKFKTKRTDNLDNSRIPLWLRSVQSGVPDAAPSGYEQWISPIVGLKYLLSYWEAYFIRIPTRLSHRQTRPALEIGLLP